MENTDYKHLLTDKPEQLYKFFDHKGKCGFANLGNTCFMNTMIHCLNHTLPLTKYILTEQIKDKLNEDKVEKHMVEKWYELISGMWNENCVIAPHSFHRCVQILSMRLDRQEFLGMGQKDTQEFFNFVIDTMHKGLAKKVHFKIEGEPQNEIDKCAIKAMESWSNFFKNDHSFIVDLFYGQYDSRTMCTKCGYETKNYEPFSNVTLPIPPNQDKKVLSIYDCFEHFNRDEELDTDNQWRCDKCQQRSNAHKKNYIWKTPDSMVICLKRFKNTQMGVRKIVDDITFPLKDLDINKYCYGYGRDGSKFDLYAVANHMEEGGGHYYAYVKNVDDTWYELNDTNISKVHPKNVVTKNAYCLFYQKKK